MSNTIGDYTLSTTPGLPIDTSGCYEYIPVRPQPVIEKHYFYIPPIYTVYLEDKKPHLCPKCRGEDRMDDCRVCSGKGVLWG